MRHPIFPLTDKLVDEIAALSPSRATLAGVPGHDHRWDDFSPAGAAARASLLRRALDDIAALPPAGEDRFARLGCRVASEFLRDELSVFEHGEHVLDLNSIDSSFQLLRMPFDVMPADQPENLRARLDGLPGATAGYRALLDEGRRAGRTVARRQVLAVIDQARATKDYFPTLNAAPRDQETAIRAFAELADWLEQTYLPAAQEADPVGPERYARSVRRFLGVDLDPVETYAWGWREIESIEAKMVAVAREINPDKSVAQVIDLLKNDRARCAPDVPAFIEIIRGRQARALAELDAHFDIPAPIRNIDVKRAPPGG
jgi:uncharacterized protein (DUF885 family)